MLVARNRDRLAEIADDFSLQGIAVKVVAADLAIAEAAHSVFDELERASIVVDVLINNAGMGTFGPFVESDPAQELRTMQLNIVSLTVLTRLLLPGMLHRGHGCIMNVASVAAFRPGPLMAVYYASKAYVLSFSRALASELKGTGVTVTALCPGPARTDFWRRAAIRESRLTRFRLMDAAQIAQAGYRGMTNGKTTVIPGWRNKALAAAALLLPAGLVVAIVRGVLERKPPSATNM